MNDKKIYLKPGKERSVERFHPWIFSGAISGTEGMLKNGDTVTVLSSKNDILGKGHFNNGSISVRLFSFGNEDIDQLFWNRKIERAWQLRATTNLTDHSTTNVFRLVHGEGDGLPGLIIDYYDGNCVIQCHHTGMYKNRNEILEALKNVLGKKLKSVYDKSAEILGKENKEIKNEYLFGTSEEDTLVIENGNRFLVNWITGQKTGFFIDQRENRALLAKYSKGKKILNTFCYSGGFSIYALNAGAEEVHSLDSSQKAIDLVELNLVANSISGRHKSIVADAIPYLKNIEKDYDIIILDPPAFAKHLSAKHNAIQGYRRLNEEAIRQIKPGGIIFTFSCSQVVDLDSFKGAVFSAAANCKREVKILHQLHQPEDHPVSIFHPEGEYLKGLVISVG